MAQLKLGTTIAGNTAWHSGNDGTGSGLDADLLDGLDSLHYLNYNNLTNKPTVWPITGTDGQMVYINDGVATSSPLVFYDDVNQRLGIGTNTPGNPLTVSQSLANAAISYFNNTDTANGNGILVRAGGANAGKYIASFQDAAANTRMHILANGNVGIGTISPNSPLHVAGDIFADDGIEGQALVAYSSPHSYTRGDGGTQGIMLDFITDVGNIRAFNNSSGTGTAKIGFITAGQERVRITDAGNVGIGTTTPSSALHILNATPQITLQNNNNNSGKIVIRNVTQSDVLTIETDSGANSSISAAGYLTLSASGPSSQIRLQSGGANIRLIIMETGLVGIGTTSPTQQLDVAGNTTLRNSTTATNLTIHNTYTDASNYERVKIGWNANVLEIGTEAAGTGSGRNLIIKGGGNLSSQGELQFSTGQVSAKYRMIGLGYSATTNLYSPSEGILRLSNGSQNDFNRLNFGGETSSYPSIKRNTTTFEIKLADDSAFTGLKAKELNTENSSQTSEATTLATVTKTQVASFPVASFRSGKLIVQAYDSVTGEVQISELLVAHNGTTASATEYGVVFTGTASMVIYDVDISAGNVRLLATRTTANSTQYKTSETLMVA